VELGVLTSGDQIAAQALVHRANVALLESDDAVSAIRAKQREAQESLLSRITQGPRQDLPRATWQ
jgi:hypothetical protein